MSKKNLSMMTARDWLTQQLEARNTNRFEFAKRHGIQPSRLTAFGDGESVKTAIQIAEALNVNPAIPLGLIGAFPLPREWDEQRERIQIIYDSLNEENRQLLADFARMLYDRETAAKHAPTQE